MVRLVDSMIRLCDHTCALSHTHQYRQHLPLALLRVTHDGSADGRIAPTPRPDANNTIWPRYRGQRIITRDEVACHMNLSSGLETQFSSCTTWFHLSSRIDNWKAKGVRNLRVHVIFTPSLPQTTEIYKATGLVHRFNLRQQPYYEEEYLVRGLVHSTAIIVSFSGEGEDILLDLPLFGYRPFSFIHRPTVLVKVPTGLFGCNNQIPDRNVLRNASIGSDRFLAMGNENFLFRVLFDTFTRGRFFTFADYWEAR